MVSPEPTRTCGFDRDTRQTPAARSRTSNRVELTRDQHEAVRIRIGQRPQDDAIHGAEDGRVRADPERERDDGDERETGLATERTG
jgi:hypothetical protein